MSADKLAVTDISNPEDAAIELLKKTIGKDGKVTLPINIEEITRHLGIEYKRVFLDEGVDGFLVKDKPNVPFKAVVNAASHIHRARFTIAHEIGHYIHKYQNLPDDEVAGKTEYRNELSSKGTDDEEKWANSFAAALLMPSNIVSEFWAKGLSVDEIACLFDVSQKALKNRLNNLGLKELS